MLTIPSLIRTLLKRCYFGKFDFSDRKSRNELITEYLVQQKISQILNIGGGGSRYLSHPMLDVFEVDIQGDNDLTIDLEKLSVLPFKDSSFEAVTCLDSLEHLNNFHLIFEESLRISRKGLLVTLPNSTRDVMSLVKRDTRYLNYPDRGSMTKYYGLPLVADVDRHKWFIMGIDVLRFLSEKVLNRQHEVVFLIPSKFRILMKIFPYITFNFLLRTYVFWIEKKE